MKLELQENIFNKLAITIPFLIKLIINMLQSKYVSHFN